LSSLEIRYRAKGSGDQFAALAFTCSQDQMDKALSKLRRFAEDNPDMEYALFRDGILVHQT